MTTTTRTKCNYCGYLTADAVVPDSSGNVACLTCDAAFWEASRLARRLAVLGRALAAARGLCAEDDGLIPTGSLAGRIAELEARRAALERRWR